MRSIFRRNRDAGAATGAARDLVIVVVGILGALWFETWWQDRQDRSEEGEILAGLREEFVANREQLVGSMESWERAAEITQQLHGYMGRDVSAEDAQEAARIFPRVMGVRLFDPRQGQLNSIVSSGKLGLIESASLRAKIADWPALVADLDYERDLILFDMTHGINALALGDVTSWRDSTFAFRADEFFANQALDNRLSFHYFTLQRMQNEGKTILEATDEILALIDAENHK